MMRRLCYIAFVFLITGLICAASHAGKKDYQIPLRYSFLRHEALQKELKLTPEQLKKLEALHEEAEKSTRQVQEDIEMQMKNLKDEADERKRKISQAKLIQRQIDSGEKAVRDLEPRVAEILTAEQAKRCREIMVQYWGIEHRNVHLALKFSKKQLEEAHDIYQTMLNEHSSLVKASRGIKYTFPNDEVEKALNLTPEQYKILNELRAKAAHGAKPVNGPVLFHEMKQEVRRKITELMTDDQKKRFNELKGSEFDVIQLLPYSEKVLKELKEKAK
jgi:Spy/CpxP family protein refolding chaperone